MCGWFLVILLGSVAMHWRVVLCTLIAINFTLNLRAPIIYIILCNNNENHKKEEINTVNIHSFLQVHPFNHKARFKSTSKWRAEMILQNPSLIRYKLPSYTYIILAQRLISFKVPCIYVYPEGNIGTYICVELSHDQGTSALICI